MAVFRSCPLMSISADWIIPSADSSSVSGRSERGRILIHAHLLVFNPVPHYGPKIMTATWAVPTLLCSFTSHHHKCNVNNLQLLREIIFFPLSLKLWAYSLEMWPEDMPGAHPAFQIHCATWLRGRPQNPVIVARFQPQLSHFRAGPLQTRWPQRLFPLSPAKWGI